MNFNNTSIQSLGLALIKKQSFYIDGTWVDSTRYCRDCGQHYAAYESEKEELDRPCTDVPGASLCRRCNVSANSK